MIWGKVAPVIGSMLSGSRVRSADTISRVTKSRRRPSAWKSGGASPAGPQPPQAEAVQLWQMVANSGSTDGQCAIISPTARVKSSRDRAPLAVNCGSSASWKVLTNAWAVR